MSKRTLAVLTLAAAAVFLMSATGCVTMKRFHRQQQQDAQQLAEANAKIDDLQQKSEALDKSLKDTQASLVAAEGQNKQLASNVASLKDQITALEGQKAELDKALAAGQETEASYKKKISGLNYALAGLKKKTADMEAEIAAKDTEIGSLKQSEAALKAKSDDQAREIVGLNADKDLLTSNLNKTVAGKRSTTLILGILLAVAVILAIIGFARKPKSPAA
jgi:chromosome segregation ATPase